MTVATLNPPNPGSENQPSEERYGEIANTLTRLRRVWMAHSERTLEDIVTEPYAEQPQDDKKFIEVIEEYWKEDEYA